MKKIIAKIYEIMPNYLLKKISGRKRLRFFKNLLLKEKGSYKIIITKIKRIYNTHRVEFYFYAPIKIGVKAKKRGVESTLLRHSFELLSKFKTESNLNIFDVGANYGFLSMVWGRALENREGKIYSFEPSPTVSNVTQKSFLHNKFKNIKLFKKAIGNINGHVDIYDGKASSNMLEFDDSKKIRVEITSLDQFIIIEKVEKVDLIKIDVDGFEYEILQGAKKIIQKYKPILIVETNNDSRILDFVRSIGYTILDMKLDKVFNNDVNIPSNIFCVETKAYDEIFEN
jgi:FkbM family methyltransferase